jgi:hypothetical protein
VQRVLGIKSLREEARAVRARWSARERDESARETRSNAKKEWPVI